MKRSDTRRPRGRALVLSALMVTMALAAVEATIVATAVPSIALSLGGVEIASWVFAAYLLTQAVTAPLYGGLADLYGRKPVLLIGIGIFLIGALFCGLANSMTQLIAMRLVQGLGAGAIHTTVSTLAGDLYSPEERGRVQAYLSSVWGVSAILGPLLGALAIDLAGWPWIFWFNIPVGILAMFGLWRFLEEEAPSANRRIDLFGGALVFFSTGALMLALTQWTAWGLRSAAPVALAGVTGIALFVRHAHRVDDPLIPVRLFRDKLLLTANLTTFAAGVLNIGLIAYIPGYVQEVLAQPPIVAGFALTTMSVGWPLASFVAGRLLPLKGIRFTSRIGGGFALAGSLLLAAATPTVGPLWFAAASFVTGCGFGLLLTTLIVAIQSTVPWSSRASATSTNMLMRHVGNALGAAMLGGVFALAVDSLDSNVATAFAVGGGAVFDILAACGAIVFVLATLVPGRELIAGRGRENAAPSQGAELERPVAPAK